MFERWISFRVSLLFFSLGLAMVPMFLELQVFAKLLTLGSLSILLTGNVFLGINWSEEQAEIIKAKLEYLWVKKNSLDIVEGFDFNSTVHEPSNTDYLYDPEYKLSTVDCDWKEDLCETYWSGK